MIARCSYGKILKYELIDLCDEPVCCAFVENKIDRRHRHKQKMNMKMKQVIDNERPTAIFAVLLSGVFAGSAGCKRKPTGFAGAGRSTLCLLTVNRDAANRTAASCLRTLPEMPTIVNFIIKTNIDSQILSVIKKLC